MKITDRHLKAAEMLAAGKTMQETAEAVGVTLRTIAYWKEKPEFQNMVQELHEKALNESKKILIAHAEEAAQKLVQLMNDENVWVAMQAIREILDRIGVKSPDNKALVNITNIGDKYEIDKEALKDPEVRKAIREIFRKTIARDNAT